MIAIVVPTRGMLFTEVAQAIQEITYTVESIVLYTWDKVIPDAHNELAAQALALGASHILFVEEDTVPPRNAVIDMLRANAAIACIDYGVNGYSCTAKTRQGDILWCGLGCTLIKKEVFEKLEKPWFRTDKVFRLNDRKWIDNPSKYGGQDIWFSQKAREKGFDIVQVKGEARHLKLEELGRSEWNNGLHEISEKPKISKQQIIGGGGLN